MIIDSHVHLGESLYGYSTTSEDIFKMMEEIGVDLSVVCPVKPKNYDIKAANTYVADEVKKSGGKFIGLMRIDPWQGEDAIREINRCADMGLRGIQLHPAEDYFRVNSDIVMPVANEAKKLGLSVFVEGGYPHTSHPLQIADLARRFPEVEFIMSNGGELDLSGFTRGDSNAALFNTPNLSMGTSGLCSHERLKELVSEIGAHRIAYESHFPIMDPRLEILRITTADVPQEARDMMLEVAAKRLYSI